MADARRPPGLPPPETAELPAKRLLGDNGRRLESTGYACCFSNMYMCRCSTQICASEKSLAEYQKNRARFVGVPFPGAEPLLVPDPENGGTTTVLGVRVQPKLLHGDPLLRARVVAATNVEYDPERKSPLFICACHLDLRSIVPGQRAGSWVLAAGEAPLTPRQKHERAAPLTQPPLERAIVDGRFPEVAVILHEHEIASAASAATIAALQCVCCVTLCSVGANVGGFFYVFFQGRARQDEA
jgi:hypothetical protein